MENGWHQLYEDRRKTAKEALRLVRKGSRVFIGSACAEPQYLVRSLAEAGTGLADTEIIHILTFGVAPYIRETFDQRFRLKSFFVGEGVRQAVADGRADYVPISLSDVPGLFRTGKVPVDVALIQVSPPDEHGYCSLGISVDIVKAACRAAEVVVAQVNPQMPRVLGNSFLHVKEIDYIIEHEEPLLEIQVSTPNETSLRIGKHVAGLVTNGSTLQMGIGAIPNAVLHSLKDKRDLGIHTEMFSDALIDLVQEGVVNNSRKTLHPGKIISSFCIGSRRLYDFVHNNPSIEFHPSDYTNNPSIIARNHKMVAINGALEVDLTGQACADSLGYCFFSGIGGHLDFMRGAAQSPGGKPIIAMSSVNPQGTSRIVPHISEGAGVVSTRSDVHYVVTEYGVAYLHGKTIRERALALINIAHPRFREELLHAAKEHNYVYPDQSLPLAPEDLFPYELEKPVTLRGGEHLLLRPVKPTDERPLQELFYSLKDTDVYMRFHGSRRVFPHRDIKKLMHIDYRREMVLVAVYGPAHKEKVVGIGRYVLDEASGMAEADFTVHGDWQGKGVGTALFGYLVEVARRRRVKGFILDIIKQNTRMLRIVYKSGYKTEGEAYEGEYHLSLRFDTPANPSDNRPLQ